MIKEIVISDELAGKRLDVAAHSALPDISRSKIQEFDITINGRAAKLSEKVRSGDKVSIVLKNEKTKPLAKSKIKLEILFEDEHIIVAIKPRGVATHPGAGNEKDTFVQMLLGHTKLSAVGGELRPGIVHRLDKDTSGILVAAKTDAAFAKLAEMFSVHDLRRIYSAFVWGVPHWESADITGNISRSKKNRQKMALVKVGGRPAETNVAVADAWTRAGISELKCELKTGRTHQIRVHLSTHGFPLIGDKVYGRAGHRIDSVKPSALLNFLESWQDGQMLHAGVLEFVHPITGRAMKFRAPLPPDLAEFKECLNEYQSF